MQNPNNIEDIKDSENNENESLHDELKNTSSKNNTNELCSKKRKRRFISSHNKHMKNPSITKFNDLSKFIYDIDEGEKYINSVGNANKLKLNDEEFKSLCDKYNSIENEKINDKKEKMIFLDDSIKKDIEEYFKINIENSDPLLLFLKKEYIENKNRVGFSSRKY